MQRAKAELFKQLHHRDKLFVLPNPWDVGSAMLDAARGILDNGQFDAFETAASFKDIEALIQRGGSRLI